MKVRILSIYPINCLWKKNLFRLFLLIILSGLGIRFIPYLIPIRSQDIQQKQLAVEFSDRKGLPLGRLLSQDQNQTAIVPLKQISPVFLQAIIAAEDKRYYRHGALDSIALSRALLEALQAGEIVSGASTITMQLARMLNPSPRTAYHKMIEVWLSWRLTAGMSKDDILKAYINRLPMGGNLYGIEAASRAYFAVPSSDLNLAQASLLAGLPNDPTDLNPYYNWQGLKQRQQYILNRMVEDNYITENQAKKAYEESIKLQPRQQGIIAAPHFLFWVNQQLSDLTQSLDKPPSIQTTLNRNLQQFVDTQVQHIVTQLSDKNVNHGAAIVIDNQTREVLAYVGSPDYFNHKNSGQNDGVQALRQPGSTLKPFLYQLAIAQEIIRPNSILADVPTYYAIPGAKLYSPTDYSETFLGPVRVRIALANSLNIPAVRILEKVGVPVFLNQLQNLGFKHLDQSPDYYGLGLTLGSGEVSLWELAQAYVTLANQGEFQPLKTFDCETIFREHNNICENSHLPLSSSPNQQQTWNLITHMLSDNQARAAAFGVDSVLNLPFEVAVKTGTSSDYRDTWTVGFTNKYTVATWVGNFDGQPMKQVSGVMGAGRLWSQIMLELHRTNEPESLPLPEGLIQLPICATTGQRPTEKCSTGIVLEYFDPEEIKAYQTETNSFQLTSEYNEWLTRQSQSKSLSNQLKILSPQADDYFIFIADTPNQLEFKINHSSEEPVEWWLNNQKITTQLSPSFFWTMQPGEWTLTVKQGSVEDTVTFQVQPPNPQFYPQGFSVIKGEFDN
ncbi:MAG: penicillin-binding protein 1C [Microcoleaceae cyanobacterium]